MNGLDWFKALAPTVSTLLGGPLAGLVVEGLGQILGLSNATKDTVTDALKTVTMGSDQLMKLKELEETSLENVRRYNIDLASLEVKDRDSARQREIGTKDSTNRILAFTIISAFLAMVGCTLLGYAKVESALAGTLIGYLSAKAEQVLSYYFGSTQGSTRKTEIIAQQGQAAAEAAASK